MKKLILILFISLISISLFADVSASGDVSTVTSGTPSSAEIKYTINPSTDLDSFVIGFSTGEVSDFTPVTALANATNSMTIEDGKFIGTLSNVYVFWQIASNTDSTVNVSLTASTMVYDSTNYIDVKLETEKPDAESNEDGTATLNTDYTEETTTETVGGRLLEFSKSNFSDGQCAGCQKVTVTTENITGKTAGSYEGTLTVTISNT